MAFIKSIGQKLKYFFTESEEKTAKREQKHPKYAKWIKTRTENTEKYKMTNLFILLLFPVFITTMAEIIQMKTPAKFVLFLFERPTVVLFNIILCYILFTILLCAVKKGWIAILGLSVAYTFLAIVELFKFNTSGNHLILTDMTLAKNIKNLTSFAYIKITFPLVVCVLIVLAYAVAAIWFNPKLKLSGVKRGCTAAFAAIAVAVVISSPSLAIPVYSFFEIDTSASDNVFRINEKFEKNNFLAFITQTTTEYLNRDVEEPENYDAETIGNMIIESDEEVSENFIKPNVIVIMSEAFADFRMYQEQLGFDMESYRYFENILNREDVYEGRTIVPAFGSYTVRTEFELLFGLPVKSLKDPNMPQRLLLDRPQQTIPAYYKDLGYYTSYVHTFTGTFYSRQRRYANYGFDELVFEDAFPDAEYYKTYMSDKVIFDYIEETLSAHDEPVYLHTTTMQNHQPYDSADGSQTELEYYLEGVTDMTMNLEAFIDNLSKLDEPTVVVFVGDHFPCFKGVNSVYNQLEITSQNCNTLYEQTYFMFNNFGLDYDSVLPAKDEPFSVFWMSYLVMDLIEAPKSDFIDTMSQKFETLPVYTTNYDNQTPADEQLDMFTYDIVMGNKFIEETENEGN